jgi:glycosyltransferase involved in cell wall biosynthesis
MDLVSKFIAEYKGNYIFKIIRHSHNKGLSGARNTGIRNATGDYIYFLDSDDQLTKDCFERLSKPLETELYDIVVGGFEVSPKQNFHTRLKAPDDTVFRNSNILKQYGMFNIYMMAWNKLCRRSFIVQNSCYFYEGILHEDELWSYMISVYAESMFVVNRTTYKYNLRTGSIMNSSKLQRRINDLIIICKEILKIADNKGLKYNYYSNRCLQNILSKPISLCQDKREAYSTYEYIRKFLGNRKFDSLFANGLRIRAQLQDFHWLIPCNLAFLTYIRFNHLNFGKRPKQGIDRVIL